MEQKLVDSDQPMDQDEEGDTSSEDSSSPEDMDEDSSSEDDDQKEEKALHALAELQKRVEDSPYTYDLHLKLIEQAKECGDLDVLRRARQRMSEIFPLTEAIWKAWIDDEINVMDRGSPIAVDKIKQLYERAVQDYISVDLWIDYAMFCLHDYSSEEALVPVREIFERAIMDVGIHVVKGTLLWSTYREIETQYLTTLLAGDGQNALHEAKIMRQLGRIKELYKRQFSIPSLGMEAEHEAYLAFADAEIDPLIERIFQQSKSKLKQIRDFEHNLETADDNERFKIFMSYIDYEIKSNEPVRARNLFERALVFYCLSPELWIRYLDFLDRQLKVEQLSISAHERAVRNLPWVFEIWPSYMRAAELYGKEPETVTGLFQRATATACSLPNHFVELWIAYLCYFRRRFPDHCMEEELRQKFQQAFTDVQTTGVDIDNQIARLWSNIEVGLLRNITKSRELWDTVIIKNHQRESLFWLEYFHLERKYGDASSCRKILKQAVLRNLDNVELIAQTWIQFECEHGSLADWFDAHDACRNALKKMNERLSKAALETQDIPRKRNSQTSDSKPQAKPRKERTTDAAKKTNTSTLEKRKNFSPENANVDAGFKIPAVPTMSTSKKQKVTPSTPSPPIAPSMQLSSDTPEGCKPERTVFISNLNYRTTEEAIFSLFSPLGLIRDIRFAKDPRGHSRGFGFVEFVKAECAKEALKLDRHELEGRPVYVSKDSEGGDRESHFKGTPGSEENKLFISKLATKVTKEDLMQLFQPYEGLKDIRIVTHKNGTSKGIAYVEFADSKIARRALQEMDGKEIEGRPMAVALSNPPVRSGNAKSASKPQFTESSSRASRPVVVPAPEGQRKSRSHVDLLPRVVQQKPNAPNPAKAPEKAAETAPVAQKSNADFRALLMKK